MITIHEAIRNIQDELIKSEQERRQKGIPKLFKTEKLTVELSCIFSKTDSTDMKGGMNVLSVLALDETSTNSVSSEKIQKIILEFKTADKSDIPDSEQSQMTKNTNDSSFPSEKKPRGEYPYEKRQ